MKQMVVSFGLVIIVLLSAAITLALGTNQMKKYQLENAVDIAIFQALQEGVEKQVDPGILFETHLHKILPEAELDIHMKGADYLKGILSAEVTRSYFNMGESCSVTVERTVIYERE